MLKQSCRHAQRKPAKGKRTQKFHGTGALGIAALCFSAVAGLSERAQAASLVEWNTFGNAGTESTEPTSFVATNATASALSLGTGVVGAANGNRLGGNAWFDTGDTNPTTLAESISGNDYIEFTITPDAGYSFTATGFNFIWDHSSTGPAAVALRSSADGFSTTLASATGLVSTQTAFTNLAFTLSNITAATTFRLYGYSATAANGTAGFDTSGTVVGANVLLIGSVTLLGNSLYWDTNSTAAGSDNTGGLWSGANWNTAEDGTGTPATFTTGKTAVFAAGTNATGTYTVTVDTAASVDGLTFEEGTVTVAHGTGGSLTFTGTGRVNVASGAAAVVGEAIGGTVGLTKDGAGPLALSATNTYTGTTTINAGVLEVSSDANLGDPTNGVVLAGGTLKTATDLSLAATRNFDGSGGLDVADGKTLTINGRVGGITPGTLTLNNTGTVELANGDFDKATTGVIFTAPGTLKNTTTMLILGGNVTTSQTNGTAAITGDAISLGSTSRTFTVGDGSADTDLLISAAVTSTASARILKRGAGTLKLTGDNSGLYGIQIGAQGPAADGGRVVIDNPNALGAATTQIQLNYGKLEAATDLTGANAIVSGSLVAVGSSQLSFGGRTTGYLTLAGSPMEFTAGMSFFRATNTTGELRFNVDNTTTISGLGVATSGSGSATGVTIGGSGKLILKGDNSAITETITTIDSLNLVAGGTLNGVNVSGTSTLSGDGTVGAVTVATGAKVSPGDNSVDTLTVGSLTLGDGAVISLELDFANGASGSAFGDLIVSNGAVALGNGTAILQLAVLNFGSLPSGFTFTLIDNTSGAGTSGFFAGLPEGASFDVGGQSASITYQGGIDGKDVLITIPEPSTGLLALTGLVGALGWRRRRQAA